MDCYVAPRNLWAILIGQFCAKGQSFSDLLQVVGDSHSWTIHKVHIAQCEGCGVVGSPPVQGELCCLPLTLLDLMR